MIIINQRGVATYSAPFVDSFSPDSFQEKISLSHASLSRGKQTIDFITLPEISLFLINEDFIDFNH